MNIDQTISELNALPVTDRIRIIAAIWDSMADSDAKLTTPEQDAELNRRLLEHRKDPTSSLTREELERRISDQ
jgi:putative addiction module component (TIGR02574 family)